MGCRRGRRNEGRRAEGGVEEQTGKGRGEKGTGGGHGVRGESGERRGEPPDAPQCLTFALNYRVPKADSPNRFDAD